MWSSHTANQIVNVVCTWSVSARLYSNRLTFVLCLAYQCIIRLHVPMYLLYCYMDTDCGGLRWDVLGRLTEYNYLYDRRDRLALMWHGTHIYNYTPACPACLPTGIISHLYHTPLIYNITVNTSSMSCGQAGGEGGAGTGVTMVTTPDYKLHINNDRNVRTVVINMTIEWWGD